MSVPLINEYYDRNMGRGKPIVLSEEWRGAAPHTTLSLTPDALSAIFIDRLDILATDNFALASDSIRVHKMGNFNSVTYVDIVNLVDLIAYSHEWQADKIAAVDMHKMAILFNPPLLLRVSDSDVFEVEVVGVPAITGTIRVTASGWQILEADAGFDEEW